MAEFVEVNDLTEASEKASSDSITYIVTGATGFLGNNIIRALRDKGRRVVGFARSEAKAREVFKGLDVEICLGDVRRIEDLSKMFESIASEIIVIHTAEVVSIGEPKQERAMREVNLLGTRNVVALCVKHKVKRLAYISSVHAIPEEGVNGVIKEVQYFDSAKVKGGYAKSKAQSSQLVLDAVASGLDAVILHPTGIMGAHDFSNTHLTRMVDAIRRGLVPAAIKGGYDFVDVKDVAEGTLLAIDKGRSGECYLLSGRYVSVKELINTVNKALGRRLVRATMPMWVVRLFLPFIQLYLKLRKCKTLFTRYSLYTLGSNSNISNEKAKSELGYTVRSLEESIKDLVG